MVGGAVCAVEAVLALALLGAFAARVIALAVLFLALCFPAVTMSENSPVYSVILGVLVPLLGLLLGLFDLAELLHTVGAIATVAVRSTQFPARKALAVHLKTARFLAVAAGLLRGDRLDFRAEDDLAVDTRAQVLLLH